MKKNLLPILLLLLAAAWTRTSMAQETSITVHGRLVNYITQEGIDSARIELLSPDSTFLREVQTHTQRSNNSMNRGLKETLYEVKVPSNGKYILRCTRRGFRTEYVPLEVAFKTRKNNEFQSFPGPLIEMKLERKSMMHGVMLEGVEVAATKLKFYQRGDTLVYDADAFNLSEGSMLDALIQQLPGAELKSDGRIFINGRFVESLLLNGRDFFKGDNRIMLDNLPAYMVKNVEVYDKQHEYDKRRLPVYTMDVKLKKQYEIGWLGNVSGGIGTDGRYMARMFGLRFTKQSRIALFGNLNNVNENQKPGLDGEWKPSNVQRGLLDTKQFGIDYQIYDKHQVWTVEGNTVANFADSENEVLTRNENFLEGGNTYGQSFSRTTGDNFSIRTNNILKLNWKKPYSIFLRLTPNADYTKTTNRGNSTNGLFDSDPSDIADGMALIDSIRSLKNTGLLRKMAINRTLSNSLYKSTNLGAGTNYSFSVRDRNDFWHDIDGGVNYRKQDSKNYSQNLLEYYQAGLQPDLRNNYTDDPKRHLDFHTKVSLPVRPFYYYGITKRIQIYPYYEYRYRYDKEAMGRFRLDRIAEWAAIDESTLGSLPADGMLESVRDRGNSYDEVNREHRHIASLYMDIRRYNFGRNKDLGFELRANIPVEFVYESTGYQRSSLDTTMSRRAVLFNPDIRIDFNFNRKDEDPNSPATISRFQTPHFTLSYNAQQELPRHTYLLNVRDDYNPLYITRGNANLKRTTTHRVGFDFNFMPNRWGKSYSASIGFKKVDNAVTMGYVYDRATGVRQVMPANVDGNWTGNAQVKLQLPLGKKQRWAFSSTTTGYLNHNVDLIAVSGSAESNRREVDTRSIGQLAILSYRVNSKTGISAKGQVDWIDADSKASDFNAVSAVDFNYGLAIGTTLPGDIQLTSEMVCYSRRGYNDKAMNTDELVWNAKAARSFFKGKLTLTLNGFDMLGQLSNIQRAINAQGRTESTYNVMPRYVMLTAALKLSKQPKKK